MATRRSYRDNLETAHANFSFQSYLTSSTAPHRYQSPGRVPARFQRSAGSRQQGAFECGVRIGIYRGGRGGEGAPLPRLHQALRLICEAPRAPRRRFVPFHTAADHAREIARFVEGPRHRRAKDRARNRYFSVGAQMRAGILINVPVLSLSFFLSLCGTAQLSYAGGLFFLYFVFLVFFFLRNCNVRASSTITFFSFLFLLRFATFRSVLLFMIRLCFDFVRLSSSAGSREEIERVGG